MRKIIKPQLEITQVPIHDIKINLQFRDEDEIPKILILDYQVFYGITDSKAPKACPVRNIENPRM